jgi:hypothetical protein
MCKFIFCSDGSLARFLDIREQDAPTTNFIFAKLGCSRDTEDTERRKEERENG